MARKSRKAIRIDRGSGNVFADLGLPHAQARATKAGLAVVINRIIESRRLSQAAAAQLLGVNQTKISALINYRLDGFSFERLLLFLTALGRDVQIVIRAKRSTRTPGRILIEAV